MLSKAGKIIFAFLILFLLIVFTPRLLLIGKSTPHKVYVAFGFHGNLYHSFWINTNDEAGFGRDIRVIRHIIQTFDESNKKGIPAKAVWGIENLFSLQETLPKYSPDIIQNIQRRVKENGDEVILMSYNNGLVSALTKKEFKDAIQRAIRNLFIIVLFPLIPFVCLFRSFLKQKLTILFYM